MMTGKTFYSSDDVKGIVEKHVFMPHISSLSVKFTGNSNQQMVSVLEKMILRDPQRRIQSYKEAGAMLFNLYKACA